MRFDVIVSNPPYIASGDPHLEQGDLALRAARRSSPTKPTASARSARSSPARPRVLPQRGVLWMEHGYDQAEAVRELLTAQGFVDVRSSATSRASSESAAGGLPEHARHADTSAR